MADEYEHAEPKPVPIYSRDDIVLAHVRGIALGLFLAWGLLLLFGRGS